MERLKSNGKLFCFKNKFLNFLKSKKFSTEIFLTFRELQPLVSDKRVSYQKNTCISISKPILPSPYCGYPTFQEYVYYPLSSIISATPTH